MKSTMKAMPLMSQDRETVYVDSDMFFNRTSSSMQCMEDMGVDVQPVDVFGGFVPQNKSLSNLKKNEKAIQKRFGLEAGGERD